MQSQKPITYKLTELIQGLDVVIRGDTHCLISGIAPIQYAQPGQLTFLANPSYRKHLAITKASAIILSAEEALQCAMTAIVSDNPYYTYAKIAAYFDVEMPKTTGVHPTASLGEGTVVDPSVSIGANSVIGQGAKIAANVIIGAGCVIGDNVSIDEASVLSAHVTICHKVKIGKRCCIASGAVVGSDGFGFAMQNQTWHKIPQLGSVSVGDDVDIGANTTIDRGAMGDTIIRNGVKLDNLIQVGHNVEIGENTIIAGCTAIAGSVTIGKNCMIGGAVCFAGHINIQDNVMITGMTAVTKSINESGIFSSGIVGAVPNHEFRKNNARFHRLENLMQKMKKLESTVKAIVENERK